MSHARRLALALAIATTAASQTSAALDAAEQRTRLLAYWGAAPTSRWSFECTYGRAQVGPDWHALDPDARESRRRGILAIAGPRYLLAQESLHPDEPGPATEVCEWFDGRKTCRYALEFDAGLVLPSGQGEDLPGSRILQGMLFEGLWLPEVVADGTGARSDGTVTFRLERPRVVATCVFDVERLTWPRRVELLLAGGTKLRTIDYAEFGADGVPSAATVTTLNPSQPGRFDQVDGAIRFVTTIRASRLAASPTPEPWFPCGTLVVDGDTGEEIEIAPDARRALDDQFERLDRISRNGVRQFADVRAAFAAVEHMGRELALTGMSLSELRDHGRRERREAADHWKCAATVAYASLRSLGADPAVAEASLQRIGAEMPTPERFLGLLSRPELRDRAWVETTGEQLATTGGRHIVIDPEDIDQAGADIGHVRLVDWGRGGSDTVAIFDYPKTTRTLSRTTAAASMSRVLVLPLAGPTPATATSGGGTLTRWLLFGGATLCVLALVWRPRARQAVTTALLAALIVGLGACGDAAAAGRLTATVVVPSEPLAVSYLHELPFTIRNHGATPVKLKILGKSCNCFEARLERDNVEAGGEAGGVMLVRPVTVGHTAITLLVGDPDGDRVQVPAQFRTWARVRARPNPIVLEHTDHGTWEGELEVLTATDDAHELELPPQLRADRQKRDEVVMASGTTVETRYRLQWIDSPADGDSLHSDRCIVVVRSPAAGAKPVATVDVQVERRRW